LQQVAALARGERLALFVDEVTYLIDVNPAIVGTLQKAWDQWLSKSNLMFGLSGSQMGLMQKQIISYQAPLYGRATAQIKLPPLPFDVTSQFFPDYEPPERVAVYAIFGGIPAYWERLDAGASVMENVRSQLLTSNTLMQEEPRLLLQDFINDPHNYVGIMRAIAHGEHTQNGISKMTGLSKGHVSKYLSVLRETGFVEREVPVTESEPSSRLGRYFVTDPYLRFYYRFLSSYQLHVALGAQQQALKSISQSLPEFIEDNTWRELCQGWLLRASGEGEFPVMIEQVGSAWKRNFYFDVVGINRMEKILVAGSCQWQNGPADLGAIRDLVMQAPSLIPRDEPWRVYYLGFASGGWSRDALDLADRLVRSGKAEHNWRVEGVQLLDLARVDADMARWSMSPN
jgi:AAA+ ATPase superfamily predicted ATPase